MPVKIFFCYAHEDEALLKKLKTQLRPLQREGLIDVWYDRDISAGTEWEQEIRKHLNDAQIILLLISPDFMDSDYCYGIEMKQALERHQRGDACVIPIILEYVYWQIAPLIKLQALPTDAEPIVSKNWHSQNEALYNVVQGVRKVVGEIGKGKEDEVKKVQGKGDEVEREPKTSPAKEETELKAVLAVGELRGTQEEGEQLAVSKQPIQPVSQLDSDAVAEEASELEKQFQASGYTGRRNGPYILEVKGTLPVVISAPHAVRCGIKVQKQTPQMYTGALALQLATLTGASALVSARTSDEDPNRDVPGQYKPKLATLVRETHACFVLDIHGSDENFVKEKQLGQVEIGTVYNRSLRGKRFLRKMLEEALENAGITVTVDKYFTADAPGTITLQTSEELDTPAMQLEITRSLRDPDRYPQKYVNLLSVLRDAIIAMYTVCRERKN